MTQTITHDLSTEQEEVTSFSTKIGFSIILSFGIMLTIISFGFITIGMFTTQLMGVVAIPINLITIGLVMFGAVIATYYYHTRYVRKEMILEADGFCLKIGRRTFEYKWADFSLVVLSVAYSHYGAKGFIIKLYVDALDSEYVDLPIYRFSGSIDVFDLRQQITERVRLAKSGEKKQSQPS